jgi:two-component system sensor histidine kinase PhoQ
LSVRRASGRAPSLTRRLLIAASAILATFLGLTGFALDRAFRESVLELSRERLQARIYMLLGAAEVSSASRLTMPQTLPEPRLATPGSGAYAAIRDDDGAVLWASASSVSLDLAYPAAEGPGRASFRETAASARSPVLALTYPVIWELEGGHERYLVFQVAESRASMDAEVAGFRRTLWTWLGGAVMLMFVAQLALLVWSLAPLRKVGREIQRIEAGEASEMRGLYPRELMPLTENLNRLIGSSRTRLQRYRDSLGDLAHSLKTPLAVLRTELDDDNATVKPGLLREQVERMEQSIRYQLQRAAASGHAGLAAPVDVRTATERIARSLDKVYADKQVHVDLQIDAGTRFRGDAGDLDEILGNLADNACKFGLGQVRITASNESGATGAKLELVLDIEDDGPGIDAAQRAAVLERGVRADTLVPGQGIGLAVVRDIVENVYGGSLEISTSPLGGARIRARLP